MKQVRKILVAILGTIMLMTIVIGCGSSDDNTNSATDAPSVNPTEDTAAATDNAGNTDNAQASAQPTANANAEKVTGAKEGTYTATAKGYASDVTVTVTIDKDGAIDTVQIDASGETETIGQAAAPKLAEAIETNQNLAVDTVSGATFTCSAVLTAVDDALQQAGVDTTKIK